MITIIGFIIFVLFAIGVCLWAEKNTPPEEKKQSKEPHDLFVDSPQYDYEDEKFNELYRATEKRLKLNLMQMEAFRQMSEAAEKHWKQPHQSTMFDDIDL